MNVTSIADLKFLLPLQQGRFRNFKSKAMLEIMELLVPLCFRSSYQKMPRCITNFESGALVLYVEPEQRDVRRWLLAALVVTAFHIMGMLAAVTIWHMNAVTLRTPGTTIPIMLVELSPVSTSSEIQNQDLAPGPTMQQAEAPSRQPDKPQQIQETVAPTPPQQSPIIEILSELQQKPASQPHTPKPEHQAIKKHDNKIPAPKTTATPRAERHAPVESATIPGTALANPEVSYRIILAAHLQRFKQYPAAARKAGEQGTAMLNFTINHRGQVLSSRVSRSSGYPTLDAETIALIHRAQPLPAFLTEMKQTSMSFSVPIHYSIR